MPLVTQLRGLVSEPELRGLTADLRPTVPALAQLAERERAAQPAGAPRRRAARTRSILPWSKDKLADTAVPGRPARSTRRLPKPFPGLAGESRSGDANGQWFRVLAAGGTNLVTFGPACSAPRALPILGVNPPKPKARPPLNENVPCETQQTPDLRSQARRAAAAAARSTPRSQLFKDRCGEGARSTASTG